MASGIAAGLSFFVLSTVGSFFVLHVAVWRGLLVSYSPRCNNFEKVLQATSAAAVTCRLQEVFLLLSSPTLAFFL